MLNLLKDFPILKREVAGDKRLVYLDNAATSQKPQQVIDAISNFYSTNNSNVHRGIHTLSEEATEMYENARKTVANYIGATVPKEVIFTKGTTDSLNSIVQMWGLSNLKKGDIILTTLSEHHSNLVPWQILAKNTGAVLEFIELTDEGDIDYKELEDRLKNLEFSKRVKLVVISHASNVLGTVFDVKRVSTLCKGNKPDCTVVLDGAQAVPHISVNVQRLGCDFYAFSGHKMLGPTGIGVLWIKRDHLEKLDPYQYGGGMIDVVKPTEATWTTAPEKFEAGTPNIAGAIGLAVAIEYLNNIGMDNIRNHEVELLKYALDKLKDISDLEILGPMDPNKRTGLISFTIKGIHSHDIASVLETEGVAVRSGHHCTMPLHKHYGISASTRASFYLYNTKEDIDALIKALKKAMEILT